jgi:hypothetical protein
MKKQIFYSWCFVAILLFSCQKSEVEIAASNSDLTIKTGTSFGFCFGECQKELTITPLLATFVVKKSGKGGSNSTIARTCENKISGIEWGNISQQVDYQAFSKISETIGCPDCADGGAEWIEIQKGNETHRVTFEFNQDVKEFNSLLKILREKRTSFDNSCK